MFINKINIYFENQIKKGCYFIGIYFYKYRQKPPENIAINIKYHLKFYLLFFCIGIDHYNERPIDFKKLSIK